VFCKGGTNINNAITPRHRSHHNRSDTQPVSPIQTLLEAGGKEMHHLLMALGCRSHQGRVTDIVLAHTITFVVCHFDKVSDNAEMPELCCEVERCIPCQVWVKDRFGVVFEDAFNSIGC
jgi:hypothetical protein